MGRRRAKPVRPTSPVSQVSPATLVPRRGRNGKVLVSILTSSRADLAALCYESVAASVAAAKGAYEYTVRVVVNSTDHGHCAAVRAVVPAPVSVVRTESNGRPGKGHNSVIEDFRRSPEYRYCVLVDGDDFLYPRALARIESYLAYEPDVLLLAFHDKLTASRQEHEKCVPHFSMKDKLVWFYNLTDVTVPRWYEAKSMSPFAHDATELNTPARPLVFSRRSLDFDLAYDESARLYDDFVVCCKCLERSVLGELRVFGVVDSHVYLYNMTTPESATASFAGPERRAEENANFRASLRGKFLAIKDWAARIRGLRLLELGQADEPDHIATKYRFVEWLANKMDYLPATVVPCDNALVVVDHARTNGLPEIEAEVAEIYASRCARALPLAVTVCSEPGDSAALAHALERTSRLVGSMVVVASEDDAVATAMFAYGGAPANARLVHDLRDVGIEEGTVVMTVGPGVYLPLGLGALLPERLDSDAAYVAAGCNAFCVYTHKGASPRRVLVTLNGTIARLPRPVASQRPEGTTLVVVIGSARGGEETWRSMYAHLLVPYGADLAMHVGDLPSGRPSSSLYRAAKYVWCVPEYANWRDYYAERGVPVDAFVENEVTGIAGGIDEYAGSGAIIFAFRHSLLHDHLDVLEQYDRVILTRADHYYLADHPVLENDGLYIVEGEDYGGGVCDRHWVFPSSMCRSVLGIVEYMSEELPRDEAYAAIRGNANPEQMLALMLRANGIVAKRHRRVQFTVGATGDTTRWRAAKVPFKPEHGLYAKYETEFALATESTSTCDVFV